MQRPADRALPPGGCAPPQALDALEIASGLVFGVERGRAPLTRAGMSGAAPSEPRAALEEVLAEALARPPAVFSFSGGRDSSLMLAVATHTARQRGLPLPVPVTLRFPHVELAAEGDWQEQVIRHLDLPHWERRTLTDELDAIGPYAARLVDAHGLQWPFNLHFHAPVAEAGAGGTMVTGVGGDEVLGTPFWSRLHRIGRARPSRAQRRALALAALPPVVRAQVLRRRSTRLFPHHDLRWLTEPARRRVRARGGDSAAREPFRWDRWVRERWWPSRYRAIAVHGLGLVAATFGAGADAAHPFLDERVLQALADRYGRSGVPSRTAAMADLAGDLLPSAVITRPSKASFDGAYWTPRAREAASAWDGAGVDPAVVDVAALRSLWQGERPDLRSALLLQSVTFAPAPGVR